MSKSKWTFALIWLLLLFRRNDPVHEHDLRAGSFKLHTPKTVLKRRPNHGNTAVFRIVQVSSRQFWIAADSDQQRDTRVIPTRVGNGLPARR